MWLVDLFEGHDTSVPIQGEEFIEKLKDCGIS